MIRRDAPAAGRRPAAAHLMWICVVRPARVFFREHHGRLIVQFTSEPLQMSDVRHNAIVGSERRDRVIATATTQRAQPPHNALQLVDLVLAVGEPAGRLAELTIRRQIRSSISGERQEANPAPTALEHDLIKAARILVQLGFCLAQHRHLGRVREHVCGPSRR